MTKRLSWLLLLGVAAGVLVLVPDLWAAPGQDLHRQTVPTRTSESPPATAPPTSASATSSSATSSTPTSPPPTSSLGTAAPPGPEQTAQPGVAAPTAVSPESEDTPVPMPASVAAEAAPAPENVSVCVLAYHDRDRDSNRSEETEELLPSAEFVLSDISGQIGRYISDGVSEPFCFTDLAPGAYRVTQSPPPGYELSDSGEWAIALVGGARLQHQFGNVRSEGKFASGEAGDTPSESRDDGGQAERLDFATVLSTIAKISGVLALALAAGIVVLFVLDRRGL